MSDRELFMYDVRVRERFLAEGTITKADVESRLAALQDLEDQCEEVDLEQPALSKEPEEVVAPVVSDMQPVDRMAVVPSETPMREVSTIPAIAEAIPAAPTPATAAPVVPPPVPAIANESASPAAAPEAHGPASVPPPTASVDADWGDS